MYSYKDCYKILGINPGCNWKELRRAYKSNIQKWHPDRFQDNSNEKKSAEIKITLINIAYSQFSKYYQEHAALPQIEDTAVTQQTISTENKPRNTKPETDSNPDIKPKPKSNTQQTPVKKSKSPVFFSLLILIVSASVYYLFAERSETVPPQKTDTYSRTLESTLYDNVEPANNSDSIPPPKTLPQTSKTYFTIGSTIGEVLAAQGTPSRTNGNIWFYGESEVHFNNGKVLRWVRSNSNPLNIQLQIQPQH